MTHTLFSLSHSRVSRFKWQYLQLESDLDYPEPTVLRRADVQEELYGTLFAEEAVNSQTPPRYRLRVLKELLAKVEASIDDWDEYVSQFRSGALTDSGIVTWFETGRILTVLNRESRTIL
jgi:protein-lysine N-methyltransferase EEF2KMT